MSTTDISAGLVKQLRDRTGAGMMECKRALAGDGRRHRRGRPLLREQGMARPASAPTARRPRVSSARSSADGVGSIVGIGCETEPVSKNDEFQAFARGVLRAVHADGPDAVAAFEEERLELIGKLGENIVVVGAARFDIGEARSPRTSTRRRTRSASSSRSTAAARSSLGRSRCTSRSPRRSGRTRTRFRLRRSSQSGRSSSNSDEVQSKPEAAREKIVDGMLAKRFYAASPGGVLVDQTWIHDSSKTVGQALGDAGATVSAFTRVSVAGS